MSWARVRVSSRMAATMRCAWSCLRWFMEWHRWRRVEELVREKFEPREGEPFGQVPYIVDGDFELFESRAIVRYYGAKYVGKGPNLLGRTLEEKARVDQWLDAEAINYNPLVFPIVFNLFVLPRSGVPGNKAEAEAAVEKLDKVLEIYERQLSKTKYLAGNEFTLADLTHIPATRYIIENLKSA
ncbi:Glutathione S-transferase F10 [Ananas comosus]|uniref:glutathione transferase n=1 Tax=Ananas comosus TaxID=4615 RepID=A0A199UNJ3_ANACO|nr:Glutathione S-transferase F10 [Ananas comosus]